MDKEIQKLLEKNVITPVNHVLDEYISNIFLRPRKDVKELNEHVHYLHFKMDTFKSALKLVSQNCWFASVDLKDAYYSVPIHEDHRKFLRFEWNSVCYEFLCLPMGLSCSPRVFTKLLKPIFALLHQYGFASLIYIDDAFLQGDTYEQCEQNVNKTVSRCSIKRGLLYILKSLCWNQFRK